METIGTKEHQALVELLIRKRQAAKLAQWQLAARMGQYQSWIARIETGQRRIDVIEFFALARAIGFDPYRALKGIFR